MFKYQRDLKTMLLIKRIILISNLHTKNIYLILKKGSKT